MQTAVESVLFFHPAVWWLSRTVRDRREVCCDEIAVNTCASPKVYARALLRLEEQRALRLPLAMALGGCSGSLLGRIRKILGEDRAMETGMTSGVSVAAIGAMVITFLLGPKIGEAVAVPMTVRVRPVVAHVVAALPHSIVTQIDGAHKRVVVPAPQPPAHLVRHESEPIVVTPSPQPEPEPTITTAIVVNRVTGSLHTIMFQQPSGAGSSQGTGSGSSKGTGVAYVDGMRDAGYPLDLNNNLDSLVAMKSVGVTPEYAKSMAAAGLGKPTVHDLVALRSMGVTPEYVASLKQTGIAPKDFHEVVTEKSLGVTPEYATEMKKAFGDLALHDLITMKSLGVTPEYAAEMKQKGFGDLSVHDLITMKSLGVTPEYAAEMKQKGFGNLSVHELVTMKSLGVTPEYAAEMKQKGFGDLNVHQLISMKAQGMTPEYAGWLKQKFPQATTEELSRAAVFHLDDKFVADAKSHGFDTNSLDKLLRLKMSGLLED